MCIECSLLLSLLTNLTDHRNIFCTLWPEDEGTGSISVNVEFELLRPDMTLTDINILLPLGTTDPPAVEEIDGQYKHR